MPRSTPHIRDRSIALVLGYGGIIVGAWALYDAYDRRGRKRPFGAKFLPGP